MDVRGDFLGRLFMKIGNLFLIAPFPDLCLLVTFHYPKLYIMAHLLALNVLLLPKDLTIVFIL